jgi:hypothetical protein
MARREDQRAEGGKGKPSVSIFKAKRRQQTQREVAPFWPLKSLPPSCSCRSVTAPGLFPQIAASAQAENSREIFCIALN